MLVSAWQQSWTVENYTHLFLGEAQVAHWNHKQATLIPVAAYYQCWDSYHEEAENNIPSMPSTTKREPAYSTNQIKYRMSNKYIPLNPVDPLNLVELDVAIATRLPSVQVLPVQRQHLHWTHSMMQCTASRPQRIISQCILKTKSHKQQHTSSHLSHSPHPPPSYLSRWHHNNYKLLSTDSVNVIHRPRCVKLIAILLPIAASLLPSHHKNVLMSL